MSSRRKPTKELCVLVAKDSEEHERLFRAFVDGSALCWNIPDLFGSRDVEVRVFSAQHSGEKTRFMLETV